MRFNHGTSCRTCTKQHTQIRRHAGRLSRNPPWFDESKAFFPDFRHRALRHHAEGIFVAERIFGVTVRNSDGAEVAVRYLGEQHVKEDLGRIPTVQDWLTRIRPESWMYGRGG